MQQNALRAAIHQPPLVPPRSHRRSAFRDQESWTAAVSLRRLGELFSFLHASAEAENAEHVNRSAGQITFYYLIDFDVLCDYALPEAGEGQEGGVSIAQHHAARTFLTTHEEPYCLPPGTLFELASFLAHHSSQRDRYHTVLETTNFDAAVSELRRIRENALRTAGVGNLAGELEAIESLGDKEADRLVSLQLRVLGLLRGRAVAFRRIHDVLSSTRHVRLSTLLRGAILPPPHEDEGHLLDPSELANIEHRRDKTLNNAVDTANVRTVQRLNAYFARANAAESGDTQPFFRLLSNTPALHSLLQSENRSRWTLQTTLPNGDVTNLIENVEEVLCKRYIRRIRVGDLVV